MKNWTKNVTFVMTSDSQKSRTFFKCNAVAKNANQKCSIHCVTLAGHIVCSRLMQDIQCFKVKQATVFVTHTQNTKERKKNFAYSLFLTLEGGRRETKKSPKNSNNVLYRMRGVKSEGKKSFTAF